MFLSMTGFGTSQGHFSLKRGKIELSVEIKTVNSKYLDLNVRLPRPYSAFDADIGALVRMHLKRGRVDLNINVRTLEGADREWQVNTAQADAVRKALQSVQSTLQLKGDVTLSDLMNFPEWLQSSDVPIDKATEWPAIETVVTDALSKVTGVRVEEGRSLYAAIYEHRRRFEEAFDSIRKQHDKFVDILRDRLRERVLTLHGKEGIDSIRLEQEITLWTAKSDVKEEVDRLNHHLNTFDQLMKEGREVGRKLEFVIQEMQREVNTLGTKCPDAKLMPVIIELKTCVERIKEQIQNVE